MGRLRFADACYLAALICLPLAGVGLVRLAAGIDMGAGLQPSYLLLALAWLGRAVDLTLRGDARARLFRDPVWRPVAGWSLVALAAVGLSAAGLVLAPAPVLVGDAWPRYAKQVVPLLVMAAFLAYPALWTRGPRRWLVTVRLLAWTVLAQVVYATVLAVGDVAGSSAAAWLDGLTSSNPAILSGSSRLYLGGFTELPRWRGSMCEPLYLGSFLVGVLPWLWSRGRSVATLAAAGVLLLTWSRGAWLGAAVALVLWWLFMRRAGLPGPSRRGAIAAVGVLALVLVVVALVQGPQALAWPVRRLAATLDHGDWSNLTRWYSAQAAWRAFLVSPVVGVGWGQFPFHFYALVDAAGLHSQFQWPVVNNMPLLILSESGVVGLVAAMAGLGWLLAATWRALGRGDAAAGDVAALAAGSMGMAAQGLFFSQYNLPHLWVVPGLWLAALMGARRRRTPPDAAGCREESP